MRKPRRRVGSAARRTLPPVVSVIVPARNEIRTIARVVRNARAIMPRTEVIVVVNGSADRTAHMARKAGARVIRYRDALGHDVGRAIGAKQARGRTLLFVDADFVVPTSALRAYVQAVMSGQDVVLNSYSGYSDARRMHSTAEAKRLLNRILWRPDLQGSSLTAVPHAMSRRAVEHIGYADLAVPPKAQAKAILGGLAVTRRHLVQVAELNRRRGRRLGHESVERLILGDHAEAIQFVMETKGYRAGLTDLWRLRGIIEAVAKEEPIPPAPGVDPRLSVIIAANNEEQTIGEVIWSAKQLVPDEIIVVSNGSMDRTADIARSELVRLVDFPTALGHDVGRAVGALLARGEVLLFLDGDIVFDPAELSPFVAACRNGADLALNDVNPYYASITSIDAVSMAKRFLNRISCVPYLGFASLTAIPHAVRREAVERIGHANLAVPPLAQTIAVVNGLHVALVRGVDVFRTNRRRKMNSPDHINLVEQLILGDHVEAIQWLQSHFGPRVFFPDLIRRRDLS